MTTLVVVAVAAAVSELIDSTDVALLERSGFSNILDVAHGADGEVDVDICTFFSCFIVSFSCSCSCS